MNKFFSKEVILKLTVVFVVSLTATIFFWRYLNTYLSKSKADASAVTLSLIPSSLSFSTNEVKELQLIAQFQNGSASEKIDYLRVKVNFPKEKLTLADYVDTTASSLGRQIRVDGPMVANGSGVIVIELGASSPGSGPATNSGPITIAKIKLKGNSGNGAITIADNVEIYNNVAAAINQVTKNNSDFIVNGSGATATPTPTSPPGATLTPTSTPASSPTPTPTNVPSGNVKLNMKFKVQGIMSKPTETMSLRVKLLNKTTGADTGYQTAQLTPDDQGVWSGSATFDIDVSAKYTLYAKGQYQVQKKICDATPTETAGGTYRCATGNISLVAGDNNLDFSGIILLSGDLPDQDGTINAYDTSLIRNNLGKTDADILSKCDVNLDGKCDTQDYSLLISTLSVKNDEE